MQEFKKNGPAIAIADPSTKKLEKMMVEKTMYEQRT
jgi:hypothetical protein